MDELREAARTVAKWWNPPWWAYDAALLAFGVAAIAAALLLHPGADPRWVYFPNGAQFGEQCAFWVQTGHPCPQCGMTRAFVYAVRLRFVDSFVASPGGFGLFWWIEVAAGLALARLVRRNPRSPALPWQAPVVWAVVWMVFLYLLPWGLRLAGFNPLP